jgi:hypothetical protein
MMMRFFLKCYQSEKLTGLRLINLDRVRWIEPSARAGYSVVTLGDGDLSLGCAFFEGPPEDFVRHIISVHGV